MLVEKFEDGWPVPVLDDAVLPPEHLAWAYSAFRELHTCRPVTGMGVSPVPITAMREYFERSGFWSSMWEEARAYWLALDGAYLKHCAEQLKSRTTVGPAAPRGGKQRVDPKDFPQG